MDEPPALRHNGHWKTAVLALRTGYVALGVGLIGLVVLLAGSPGWMLAVGVLGWLAAATVTLTSFFRARRELPEPRPGLWSMRLMLIRDSVHSLKTSR